MPRQIDEARLFEVVLQAWVRDGYAGTTTRGVATAAGVNEATLFRRYGDKGGLVCAALTHELRGVPLRGLVATNDLRADLLGIVKAYQATQAAVGAAFPLLLVEAARHPELRPAFEAAWANIGGLLQILVHHQSRGTLRPEPPLAALSALLSPLFVAGLMGRAQPDRPVPIEPAAHVDGFLVGHAAEEP